ncbi:hypothetical protein NQD34_011599 [Periophthalmus magnuspinnatus]|nr:hypothetical protein NQD34_011599 [Periophthalmus magnuspinnatus]
MHTCQHHRCCCCCCGCCEEEELARILSIFFSKIGLGHVSLLSPLHRAANTTSRRKMNRDSFVLLLAVLLLLNGPRAEGVKEVKQTYNCCTSPKVPISKGCEDSFLIRDMVKARVNDLDAQVMDPFNLKDGEMQVLECVSFSHQSLCVREDLHVEEKITHYEPIPCTQEDF